MGEMAGGTAPQEAEIHTAQQYRPARQPICRHNTLLPVRQQYAAHGQQQGHPVSPVYYEGMLGRSKV